MVTSLPQHDVWIHLQRVVQLLTCVVSPCVSRMFVLLMIRGERTSDLSQSGSQQEMVCIYLAIF